MVTHHAFVAAGYRGNGEAASGVSGIRLQKRARRMAERKLETSEEERHARAVRYSYFLWIAHLFKAFNVLLV